MPDEDPWITERDAFVQSPAPRQVPASIAKAFSPGLSLKYTVLIFAVFAIISLLLCSVFIPIHILSELKLEKGPAATVNGRILTSEKSRASENKTKIFKNTFTYQDATSQSYQGVSYTLGSSLKEGEKVKVNYLISNPAIALPEGARMDTFGPTSIWCLLIPIVILLAMFNVITDRKKSIRTLSDGERAQLQIADFRPSVWQNLGKSPSRPPLYKATFVYTDTQEKFIRIISIPREVDLLTRKFESREPLTVLHPPRDRKKFILVESWSRPQPGAV